MKTLPELIHKLSNPLSRSYQETFYLYSGQDWKSHVSYLYGNKYPMKKTLWKGNGMELILNGWRENQEMRKYTNYSAIYMKIMEGKIFSTLTTEDDQTIFQSFTTEDYVYIAPFSVWKLNSYKPSVSLQLYCESYIK